MQLARISGVDTTTDEELDTYLRNSEANAAHENLGVTEGDGSDAQPAVEHDIALADEPKPAFVNFSVDDYEG